MAHLYHANAKTTVKIREEIKLSTETIKALSVYGNTINFGLVWIRCLVFRVSRKGQSIVKLKIVKQGFTEEMKQSTETIKALSEKYNLNPKTFHEIQARRKCGR